MRGNTKASRDWRRDVCTYLAISTLLEYPQVDWNIPAVTYLGWALPVAVADESNASSAACADSAVGGVDVAGRVATAGGVGCFRGSDIDVDGCVISGRYNQNLCFSLSSSITIVSK